MNKDIIFPTKWPLFDFFIDIYKLRVGVVAMTPSVESLTYEYLRMRIAWGGKKLFEFRLFDTERRMTDRIGMSIKSEYAFDYTREELQHIIDVATEEMKKIKK